MRKQYYLENIEATLIKKIENDIASQFKNGVFSINKDNYVLSINFNDNYYQEDLDMILDIIKQNGANIIITEKEQVATYRKVLILEGLDCANCAAKIERIAKRNLDYEFIAVDFATSRFIIETSNQELLNNLIKTVQDIASMVDNSIKVTTKKENRSFEPKKEKFSRKIWFLVGCLLFFILVIIRYLFKDYFNNIPEYLLYIPYILAYILLAKDVIYGAFSNIVSGRIFDEKFLMTLATLIALGIGYYDEAVSVIIFYKIGEFFQNNAVNRSRNSIASLLDIKPTHANLLVNGELVEVNPMDVITNDIIMVKTGERVPLDGIIVDGEASLDVSALTGETKFLDVAINDHVVSGSINTNGLLKIQVEKNYEDSMVSKILDLVENASSLKSKSENLISRFARYYTPIICLLAIILALSPFILVKDVKWVNFQESIYSAMIFLVASCPCALVISIPLGFFGGIGGASRHGILIKGSNYLEALANVGSIVFDKTGTLTKGMFKVEEIVPTEGIEKVDLLEYAAYCEMTSNHPIAKSIVNEYGQEKIDTTRIKIHPKSSKFGMRIFLDDFDIAVGNDTFMAKLKIKTPEVNSDGVVIYVVKNMLFIGYIIIKDVIREESKQVIEELKHMGIKTAMITGDKENIAKCVAETIGIKEIYAEMTPVDKVKKLRQLRKGLINKKQVFVGDGINDAPVLSSADVGIAMGGLGSDAAIKVADIVLMNDDLTKIPTAIRIAQKTKIIVIENIIFALTVKLVVLSLASFGMSHMWEAIFADVGVSLLAIINSLRAASIKKHK